MSGKMFLSGPIGNPQTPTEKGRLYERAALAAMVQGQLLDLGWFCHNPYGAVHYGPNFRKDSALWLQSGFVFLDDCDAICLLPGWENAVGCCAEYLRAKENCMAVYTWEGGELTLRHPAPGEDDTLNNPRFDSNNPDPDIADVPDEDFAKLFHRLLGDVAHGPEDDGA